VDSDDPASSSSSSSSTASLTTAASCPVCSEKLSIRPIRICPLCETAVHEECGDYIGGCARFACEEAATPKKRLVEYLELKLQQKVTGAGGLVLATGLLALTEVMIGLSPTVLLLLPPILIFVATAWNQKSRLRGSELGHRELLGLMRSIAPATRPSPYGELRNIDQVSARVSFQLGVILMFFAVVSAFLAGPQYFVAGLVGFLGFLTYSWYRYRSGTIGDRAEYLAGLWSDELEELLKIEPGYEEGSELLPGPAKPSPPPPPGKN